MKQYYNNGLICFKNELNIEFAICEIEYYLCEDETFKYVFTPLYSVIDLFDEQDFEGIPGLDLSLRKKEYVRENIVPTFISERVPNKNREDLYDLLNEVGLDYIEPIEYLKRTKKQYSGDDLYVRDYLEPKTIIIDNPVSKLNNFGIMKLIINNLGKGNIVKLSDGTNLNNKSVFNLLMFLYKKSLIERIELQRKGINEAKLNKKYCGRKAIPVDELAFFNQIELVRSGTITPKEAAKNLEISIDKYYRLKKKMAL